MPELSPETLLNAALGLLIVMTLAGAVLAVTLRKVFHNLLGFGLSVIGGAGVTLILGSEFVALMQLLIFLGGIAIAMVFAVMMSTPNEQAEEPRSAGAVIPAILLGLGFTALICWAMLDGNFPQSSPYVAEAWSVKNIGLLLLTDYELPFEAISILLLAAIIGSVLIARRTREPEPSEEADRG
ncbi:MAG: NADH-quinone oxidoreductase subunit J [Rickettsiales bacterium]|nr:NADH-quinone oxidoreductase subunit J [Rickettsiales bacterium]|tara:strand:+ start:2249 stop:2797 length:549 start_codon:yes stop_codon:yes gene_type:complete